MAHESPSSTDRRTFLQAGAVATASAVSLGGTSAASALDAPAKALSIPRRPLGKTGVDITILDAGTGKGAGLQRILRFAFAQGIRCFDTSERYQSEPDFKLWFENEPEVRKQIFVVTKDLPRTPAEIMGKLDQRLANMGTDYLDLFFIHSFGDNHSLDEALNFVKSRAVQGSRRRHPQIGQGQVRGHLDPPQAPGADSPGGRRRGHRRRDHASIHPLARQRRAAEQGARRLLEEGNRPHLDEADRRPLQQRREQAGHS